MLKDSHLSPREETEHDTTVFMRVVILSGIALFVLFIVALLLLGGTKMVPKANPPHPESLILQAASSLTC
jgi:heme/copper-type cytochrome/quinol oxidase subunit 3